GCARQDRVRRRSGELLQREHGGDACVVWPLVIESQLLESGADGAPLEPTANAAALDAAQQLMLRLQPSLRVRRHERVEQSRVVEGSLDDSDRLLTFSATRIAHAHNTANRVAN